MADFKSSMMKRVSGWQMFKRANTVQDEAKNQLNEIKKVFKPVAEYTEDDLSKIEDINKIIICDCEKDPGFDFCCQQSLIWFANNHEMMSKIRRKYELNFANQ